MTDTLQKFLFEHGSVRGELVELTDTWQHILSLQHYPHAIKKILGEMLSAAALLSANLKFNGTLIMQILGDGPVRLLVVECNDKMQLRATAKFSPDAVIDDHATLAQLVHATGHGRFAITLDPNDKQDGQQAYQGIVSLEGKSVADVIQNYMRQSEQLDTKLWLATNDQTSRGFLLQKIPQEGGHKHAVEQVHNMWEHSITIAATLKNDELLNTDIPTLLHRLYWEDTLRIFDPLHPQFHCGCTRQKVGRMLTMLGREEIDDALTTLGTLDIHCDFCGKHYAFDQIDCLQLFISSQ